MKDPNYSSLPQWVQKVIEGLKGSKENAETKLKKFVDDQTPSKVYVWEPHIDRKFFIQGDRITFELKDGRKLTVQLENDGVEVMGHGFLIFAVLPKVSNVVSIKFVE